MIPGLSSPTVSIASVAVAHSYTVGAHTYGVSAPELIAQNDTFLHFPSLGKLPSGRLRCNATTYADSYVTNPTVLALWSDNGGASWPCQEARSLESSAGGFNLANGQRIELPLFMATSSGVNLAGTAHRYSMSNVEPIAAAITATGLPHAFDALAAGKNGQIFSNVIPSLDGGHLMCVYGRWQSESQYTLVMYKSTDGLAWAYLSTVVPSSYHPSPGTDGPCECAIERCSNGDIICVFRTGSNTNASQVISTTDGASWGSPAQTNMGVAAPVMRALSDGTLICVTGYYPSVSGTMYVFASENSGTTWTQIYEVKAHHGTYGSYGTLSNSSGYCGFELLNDGATAILIYDNDTRHADPAAGNKLFCQRIAIT